MSLDESLGADLAAMAKAGTLKSFRHITTPMDTEVVMAETGGRVLVLSSNNYLGLCNDDRLKQAALDAKKRYEILKRCHQAEDHPIVRAIPETEYLKGYFLKVYSL